ncbi:DinB family protein [Flavisolibacter sp. BT320]|nr:DinB family protein [Flavisolibacter longurius]
MKEIILQYAAYHSWANNLLLSTIQSLPEEQHQAAVKSSFPSLYKTVLHMYDAESIWWQRLKLQEKVDRPSDTFTGDMATLSQEVLLQNKRWHQWVTNANEHALQHEFIYYNSRKERFKQPVYQMLLHLFNHGTYHRGQLVTMLRALGVEKIPQTDFIVWSRKK